MREGSLVEFKDKKRVVAAVCTRLDAGSLRLLTEANKEFNLPVGKVLHAGASFDLGRSRTETLESLKAFAAAATAMAAAVDVEGLWELLKDEPERPYPLPELAGLLYSPPVTTQQESALLRRLIDDPLFFDMKGADWIPRNEQAVEMTRQQRLVEARRAAQRAALENWLKAVWADQAVERPEGADQIVRLVAEVALLGNRSERYQDGLALLQDVGLGGYEASEAAFQLMVKLGEWDIDENLLLHEHGLSEPFAEDALAQAAALTLHPDLYEGRRDLRHLHLTSVDDEETEDIDDAISLETLADGRVRVGMHIADVAAFIPPDSPLDRLGKRRASSIYLPDRKIDMLPESLSHGLCSLVAGQDRLAVSVLVTFDADDRIVDHEIVESVIRVSERLTYDEVDRQLQEGTGFSYLHQLTQKLEARRIEAGALIFSLPEIRLRVDADKTIHFKRLDQVSTAQRLVAELMVLANQLIAEYFKRHGIPAIYRTQVAPEEPIPTPPKHYDPVLMARQRKLLKRSEMGIEPASHYGLGLSLYTQATSPIRRYVDLLMHRQLKASLQGAPLPYTAPELKALLAMSDAGVGAINQVQRASHRYWLLKYLQGSPSPVHAAIVVDVQEERAQVQLTDVLLESAVYPKLSRRLEVGEVVQVVIDQIRPRRGTIALRLLDEAQA